MRVKAAETLFPYVTSAEGSVATPEELFNPLLEKPDAGCPELLVHDDPTAPHYAWPILDDASYREFDPLSRPEMLLEPVYARTFGAFLERLRARVEEKG